MNQSQLEELLQPLKEDLQNRIESRGMLQATINKHIQIINRCIDQNITISLIHANIFPDNDVSFNHLKNLIYRARARLAKKKPKHDEQTGGNNQNSEQQYIEQNNSNSVNAFSSLAKKEQKPIHNSSSDQQAANERLQQLLMQKKQEALNENK